MKYTKLKKEFINYFVYKSGEKKGFIDTSFDLVWKWITKNFVAKSEHSEDKLGMSKQTKSTGKDSGVRKDCTSAKHSRELATISTRPKPKKIEEIEVRALGGDVEFDVISFSKINKIIQVINYLLSEGRE